MTLVLRIPKERLECARNDLQYGHLKINRLNNVFAGQARRSQSSKRMDLQKAAPTEMPSGRAQGATTHGVLLAIPVDKSGCRPIRTPVQMPQRCAERMHFCEPPLIGRV